MLEGTIHELQEYLAQHSIQWAIAALAVAIGYIIIRIVDLNLGRFFDSVEFDRTLELLLQRTLKVFLWIVLIILVAGNLGFNVSGFIAGLGVAGFVVGFAVKDVLSNLAAGTFILIKRPFIVGERVNIVGIVGEVTEVNLSCCLVFSDDEETVTIPNSKIWGNPIRNLSRKEK
jgi:small conductance mechanosensitive channel